MNNLLILFKGKDVRRLIKNFLSLSFLQGANYLLPLITLPYLARVLGVENFGLVMFAQAFILYFNVLTDYGFNLSAPREVALARNDTEQLTDIFNSVIFVKVILSLLSFLLMLVLVMLFSKLRGDWLLYVFTFGTVVGNVLLPVWFFQGVEQMKYITLLNLLSKIIYTGLLFLLIREKEHYLYVPLLNTAGLFIAGVFALIIIRRKFSISFSVPSSSVFMKYFHQSTEFFLSRVFVTLYTNSNVFVIGLVLGNAAAGVYSAAEKLFYAATSFYNPLNDALFPYMSSSRNVKLYKKIFYTVLAGNTLLCAGVFVFSGDIVHLMYGDAYNGSVRLLQILSMLGFFMVPAILLGYPFLAALGFPRYANRSVIGAAVLHLILLAVLIPLLDIYLVGMLMIVTQLVVLCVRIYGVVKEKLWQNIS